MARQVGVLLLLLLTASVIALGTGDSARTTVNWTAVPFASLSIGGEGASGGTISSRVGVPHPNEEDLARGYLEVEGALTLIARSNTNWRLTIRTPDADLGRSYDRSYVKPLSDFQLRLAGKEYLSISNSDQALTTGTRGQHELGIDYRVLFNREKYRPGDYGVMLIYTIITD
jgi:hypothetical protein